MGNENLNGHENIEWLDSAETCDTEFGHFLIRSFLLLSPAIGTSVRSRGWVERFRIQDGTDADLLFNAILMPGVAHCETRRYGYADNAVELKRYLEKNNYLHGKFWERGEFAAFLNHATSNERVSALIGAQLEHNNKYRSSKGKYLHGCYSQVDSLFRHMRNALAHGCYQIKNLSNGKRACIFQDTHNGKMTARIVLTEERLRRWQAEIKRLDEQGI